MMKCRARNDVATVSRRSFVGGAIALISAPAAFAQSDYPSRPVRIIVPTGAGAALDTIARGLAAQLQAQVGGSFVVENKPGANSTIGSEFVARAPADGYTLLYTGQAITINPFLYNTSYDAVQSFAPIATIATAPITLTVPPNSPFKTLTQLIEAARSKPGNLTYGSAGRGSPPDIVAKLFELKAGVSLTHVPYKGAAQALTDVIGERLDLMFPSFSLAQGFIAAGKVRALGIASAERSTYAPEIPTMDESGLPGFATSSWSGIVAPAGTPPEVMARLESGIAAAMEQPEMKAFFVKQGLEPNFRRGPEFADLIRAEMKNWSAILSKASDK